MSFEVTVSRGANGKFQAQLKARFEDASSDRSFEDRDCAKLASATALIIAMAIDPVTAAARATEPEAPVSPVEKPPKLEPQAAKPEPHPSPLTKRAPADEPRMHLGIGPRMSTDMGSLPQPSAGLGAQVSVWRGSWLGQAAAQWWLPRRTTEGDSGEPAGEVGLWSVDVRGCRRLLEGSVRTYACAAVEAGASDGVGIGVVEPAHPRGFWLAGIAGVALRQSVPRALAPSLGVDLGVPLMTPTYYIEGLGHIHEPWPLFVRILLGVEAELL